jgi:FlaA1/EpsC-like NDP-sugar epimerase
VPITIVKLAEELIRLHGLEPYRDIDIQFTGMRPGEKLFEELLTAEEGTIATTWEKIFIARSRDRFSNEEMENILAEFHQVIDRQDGSDSQEVRSLLRKYVRHYHDEDGS